MRPDVETGPDSRDSHQGLPESEQAVDRSRPLRRSASRIYRGVPALLKGRRRVLFARLVANGVAQGVLAVGIVLMIRDSFDRLLGGLGGDGSMPVLWSGAGFLAAAGGTAWLRFVERTDAERMGQHYTHQLRMVLFRHLNRLSPRALQRRSHGAVVLRFVGDLNAVKNWVSLGLSRAAVSLITVLLAVGAISTLNGVLAAAVGGFLGAGTLGAMMLGKGLRVRIRESRRRRSHLATNVTEKVASMAVVQVFGQSRRERKRIRRQSRVLRDAMVSQAGRMGLMRGLTQVIVTLTCGGAILLGAGEVASGRVTPGGVVAAMAIVGLLVPAVRDLGRANEYWQAAQVSLAKIREFLKTPPLLKEAPDAGELVEGPGRLEFQDLSVQGVLSRVSAVALPGSVVALVGPNGSGKSTLLSIAARLMEPDEGKVLLDGQDLSLCTHASVRRAIGMVSPDLPLMRGSVGKNIRYRWPQAPDEEIERVKTLCGMNELIAALPKGEQTRLTEQGGNLSQGQRQRIALARALLGKPRLLLLDEADAHLDEDSCGIIDRVLENYDGTVLIASHRPERLVSAHALWHVAQGSIGVEEKQPGQGAALARQDSANSDHRRLRQGWGRRFLSQFARIGKFVLLSGAIVMGVSKTDLGMASDKGRSNPSWGHVQGIRLRGDPQETFFLYVPSSGGTGAPVMVSVHGVTRNAKEHVRNFAPLAERWGVVLVAPLFTQERYPDYQSLGQNGPGGPPDQFLERILHEVNRATGARTERLFLFGYSGGGQFVHRYAMAHPHRVARVAIGAAGWYTFPDPTVKYPRGTKPEGPGQVCLVQEEFLRVPTYVAVGEDDVLRGSSLNRSRRVDSQQGTTRVERGKRWILAMAAAARGCGLDTPFVLETLRGCGHSFRLCMRRGEMGVRVFEFLFGPLRRDGAAFLAGPGS